MSNEFVDPKLSPANTESHYSQAATADPQLKSTRLLAFSKESSS